ncbi:MAG: hypothetical protein ACP5MG_06885 [Verrucomicrobiia bacterium]
MGQNYGETIIDDLRFLTEPKPLWFYLVIIAVCVLIYLLFRAIKKQKSKPISLQPLTESQIAEDALLELEKLREKMSRETSRQYAILASGIIRRYIERQFAIQAPFCSTEEFLIQAKNSNSLTANDKQMLANFLACCDFLKFALAYAEREELEKLHNAAVEFVKRTQNHKPQILKPDENPEHNDNLKPTPYNSADKI